MRTDLTVTESREKALAIARPHVRAAVVGVGTVAVGLGVFQLVSAGVGFAMVGLGSAFTGVSLLRLMPLYRHLRRFGHADAARATLAFVGGGGAGVVAGLGGMAVATAFAAVLPPWMAGWVEGLSRFGSTLIDVGMWVGVVCIVAAVVFGVRAGWHRPAPSEAD